MGWKAARRVVGLICLGHTSVSGGKRIKSDVSWTIGIDEVLRRRLEV